MVAATKLSHNFRTWHPKSPQLVVASAALDAGTTFTVYYNTIENSIGCMIVRANLNGLFIKNNNNTDIEEYMTVLLVSI